MHENGNHLITLMSCGQIVAQPFHLLGPQTESRRLPVSNTVQKNKVIAAPRKTSRQRFRETILK